MTLLEGQTFEPSVVRFFFKVQCDGEPVPGLTEDDFIVLEDDSEISLFESAQEIVTDANSYELSSLLLLDMSGSIVDSGSLIGLQAAAIGFIETLGGTQNLAIYSFDGREDIQVLVPFTSDTEVLLAGIESLDDYEVVDNSTNLNGAVIKGLEILDARADTFTDAIFSGRLLVFTDGTDQAGYKTDAAAETAAQASSHGVYAVGLSGEVDTDHLEGIGKDGALFAADVKELVKVFEELGASIVAEANSYYLLAYCSPKRAGDHEIELRLTVSDETLASLEYTFNAEEFEGGCDSSYFTCSPDEFDDADGDDYTICDGDCDDFDASSNLDDEDGDGYSSCGEVDCDDTNEHLFPYDADGDGINDACGWQQVESALDHNCALDSGGGVECWGHDDFGQVSTAPEGFGFSALSASSKHYCAIDSAGAIECWGNDTDLQVSGSPTGTFSHVAAGESHSCAIHTSGIVECWGDDSLGQVSSAPLGTFIDVTANANYSCAIDSKGAVECWGDDVSGEMSTAPAGSFTTISAGAEHACALDSKGTIECWGSDFWGQTSVTGGPGYDAVTAGGQFSCGIRTTGQGIRCWGTEVNGLGVTPSGSHDVVSAGYHHACSIDTSGFISCWGRDAYGAVSSAPFSP
jgi:uncharacterized protein YegL